MGLALKLPAVVLAALLFPPAGREQPPLRYKYKAGDKIEYVLRQDQKMSMSVNGMDIEVKVGMEMEMTWRALSVDREGNAKVKATFPRVKMSMKSAAANAEVDSKDEAEPKDPTSKALAPAVKALAGLEMTFTTDPRGEIKEVKIGEEALKRLKEMPGASSLGDMLSPNNFKSMVSGGMVLPTAAPQKGKSWTRKSETKLPFGKMTGSTKFTYDGTVEKGGRKLAKILVVPELKLESDPAAAVTVKIEDSKTKGYVLFDNSAGRVAETSMESTMKMEVVTNGMTIKQLVTQTMTMRLKGLKAPAPGEKK